MLSAGENRDAPVPILQWFSKPGGSEGRHARMSRAVPRTHFQSGSELVRQLVTTRHPSDGDTNVDL